MLPGLPRQRPQPARAFTDRSAGSPHAGRARGGPNSRRTEMSRIANVLTAVAVLSLIAGGAVLAQPAAPTSPAPTASEKAEAKKKAAEDRKMKKQMLADCRKQAKDQNL